MDRDHQAVRQEVWTRAWVATASADNCTRSDSATIWADKCLKEFDTRFAPPAVAPDVVIAETTAT